MQSVWLAGGIVGVGLVAGWVVYTQSRRAGAPRIDQIGLATGMVVAACLAAWDVAGMQ